MSSTFVALRKKTGYSRAFWKVAIPDHTSLKNASDKDVYMVSRGMQRGACILATPGREQTHNARNYIVQTDCRDFDEMALCTKSYDEILNEPVYVSIEMPRSIEEAGSHVTARSQSVSGKATTSHVTYVADQKILEHLKNNRQQAIRIFKSLISSGGLPNLVMTGVAKSLRETSVRRVLESFEGFVEHIEDDTAYVTLKSEHGESLEGTYDATKLAFRGIYEHRRFVCKTIDTGNGVEVELTPVPENAISQDQNALIEERIKSILAIDPLSGDY